MGSGLGSNECVACVLQRKDVGVSIMTKRWSSILGKVLFFSLLVISTK